MRTIQLCITLLMLVPGPVFSEWSVVTHTNTDTNFSTNVAQIENEDGYSLEIYQDSSGVIRSRFAMHTSNTRLDPGICPSFQIDNNPVRNRSINDAMCLIQRNWSEFILGYTVDEKINSTLLLQFMNGNRITYRFRTENSGYIETFFTLSGSKKALTDAIGRDLVITNDL